MITDTLFTENFDSLQSFAKRLKFKGEFNKEFKRFHIPGQSIGGKQIYFTHFIVCELVQDQLIFLSIIDNGGYGKNEFSITAINPNDNSFKYLPFDGIPYSVKGFFNANEIYLITHTGVLGKNYDILQDMGVLHFADGKIKLLESTNLDILPLTEDWKRKYMRLDSLTFREYEED